MTVCINADDAYSSENRTGVIHLQHFYDYFAGNGIDSPWLPLRLFIHRVNIFFFKGLFDLLDMLHIQRGYFFFPIFYTFIIISSPMMDDTNNLATALSFIMYNWEKIKKMNDSYSTTYFSSATAQIPPRQRW